MINKCLCIKNYELGDEIREFITNVSDVKEESITDYLMWKWRVIDSRFKHIKVKSFTRHEEHKDTGADLELELWIVGQTFSIPILFQAKKFTKEYDSYRSKIRYPGNTRAQLDTLLKYSKLNKIIPFYLIYTNKYSTGTYIVNAEHIKKLADKPSGTKIALGDILDEGYPLYSLFCCFPHVTEIAEFFLKQFNNEHYGDFKQASDNLPQYVQRLLMDEMSGFDLEDEISTRRVIAVYDLRQSNE